MAQVADRLQATAAARPAPAPTRVDLRALSEPPASPRARVRRRWLPAAVIAVAAVALTLLAVAVFNREEPNQPNASSAPASTTVAHTRWEQAVAEYYALLPRNTDEVWTRLGPSMQSQGRQQYEKTSKDVKTLTITSAPQATGADTVPIGIEYSSDSRGRARDTRQIRLIAQDGRPCE